MNRKYIDNHGIEMSWLEEILCFWTWPFGHAWRNFGRYSLTCVLCGKRGFHDYWHWDGTSPLLVVSEAKVGQKENRLPFKSWCQKQEEAEAERQKEREEFARTTAEVTFKDVPFSPEDFFVLFRELKKTHNGISDAYMGDGGSVRGYIKPHCGFYCQKDDYSNILASLEKVYCGDENRPISHWLESRHKERLVSSA